MGGGSMMKRALAWLLAGLLLIGSAALSVAAEKPDFRNVRWGMTQQEVKQAEKLALAYADQEMLGYETTLAGFDCNLIYLFQNDRLYRAGYIFTHMHMNCTDFIDDYDKVKDLLKQKYGEPKQDDVLWKDDLYRDDPSHWGMAIITGDLELCATWEKGQTIIILYLAGDNFETQFGLTYYSKEGQPVIRNPEPKHPPPTHYPQ
jgi:hypothetical protein